MDLWRLKNLTTELKKIAKEIRRTRRYPYDGIFCIKNGEPVDALGHAIERAGLLKDMRYDTYLNAAVAVQDALGLPSGTLPDHAGTAAQSVSYCEDNEEGLPAYEHRRRTASALDYLADVLYYMKVDEGSE